MIRNLPYAPAPLPAGIDPAVGAYLQQELAAIFAAAGDPRSLFIDATLQAPTKIQDGDIRWADGTGWNPGNGRGLYISIAGVWRRLPYLGAAVADLTQVISNPPTQAEVNTIQTKVNALLAALRAAGSLAP